MHTMLQPTIYVNSSKSRAVTVAAEGAGEQDSEATAPEESLGKPSAAGVCLCVREIDRQTDRQADRQIDRQADRARQRGNSALGKAGYAFRCRCVCVFVCERV